MGKVSNMWIYPVKACRGIPFETVIASPEGLTDGKVRDRYGFCSCYAVDCTS